MQVRITGGLAPFKPVLGAIISPCGVYRYRLVRAWGRGPLLPFIMLNPSTADHTVDDPTIRRVIGFAKREGAAGVVVVNLYAFRATDPGKLKLAVDPVGPDNNRVVNSMMTAASATQMPVVCAWGAGGAALSAEVIGKLRQGYPSVPLLCLGATQAGHPRHPLYVPANQPLEPYLGA